MIGCGAKERTTIVVRLIHTMKKNRLEGGFFVEADYILKSITPKPACGTLEIEIAGIFSSARKGGKECLCYGELQQVTVIDTAKQSPTKPWPRWTNRQSPNGTAVCNVNSIAKQNAATENEAR